MYRGVTDLSLIFRNRGFLPKVFHYVFRSIGVRTTPWAFIPLHVPKVNKRLVTP